MGKAYSKLFTGVLFTVININIGPIDILPNFIGYIIILNGLSILHTETSIKDYKHSSFICYFLLIESIVSMCLPNYLNIEYLTITSVGWMVISNLAQLFFVYFTYTASIKLLGQSSNSELSETLKSGRSGYVYTMMVIIMIYTFLPNLSADIRTMVIIGCIVVGFIMLISFLVNLNRLKKYFLTLI